MLLSSAPLLYRRSSLQGNYDCALRKAVIATRTGPGCVAVLPLPDVSFRQTEHSGAMDWPYPCGGRRPFSYLVDATAFRSLTLGRIPDPPFKPRQGIEGPPAAGIATNQHFLQRRHQRRVS
jgi:hypothetical protein